MGMERLHSAARLVIRAGTTLNRVGRRGRYLGPHHFARSTQAHTIRDRQTGEQVFVVPDGADKGLYQIA